MNQKTLFGSTVLIKETVETGFTYNQIGFMNTSNVQSVVQSGQLQERRRKEMDKDINTKLFADLEKAVEKESGKTLWGRSHPANVFINLQDEIIEGYELYRKLKDKKSNAEAQLKKINDILEMDK